MIRVGHECIQLKPISQMRFDYDTTTTKNWHAHVLLASNGSRRARYAVAAPDHKIRQCIQRSALFPGRAKIQRQLKQKKTLSLYTTGLCLSLLTQGLNSTCLKFKQRAVYNSSELRTLHCKVCANMSITLFKFRAFTLSPSAAWIDGVTQS